MTKISILSLLILTFSSFGISNSKQSQDSDFEKLSDTFINEYFAWRPQEGTSLGFHQYDGKLTNLSQASINSEINRLKKYKNDLLKINPDELNSKNYLDYKILLNAIEKEQFRIDDRKSYSTNPMTYANMIDVNIYIARDFAPLEDRIRSIISIEKSIPEVFGSARKNLDESLPKPYVELAIQIAQGAADFLGKDLLVALKDVKNKSLMDEFDTANKNAIKEINDFANYLTKEKLPKANSKYALGNEMYQKMLNGEMIDYTPERVLEIGLRHLKMEQKYFEETAAKIDPTKKPIEVFKEIQKDHPTAEGLIPDTKKNLEAIRQYLIDKNIISLPSEVRAQVKETPQYARATSFASMDTPGPFEKSTQAYYYVTPVEKEWSDKQKDEWLTSFNFYTTDVVSIHEAYPGHYVQFLHLNASNSSKIQKIFSSYAFVEGWAHYTEQMMLDNGFGKDKDEMKALKYRLAQLDESLLRYCRLCVSIKMHTQGMTIDEATKFFMDNCYYEENPAHQEAMRGTFDPGYLNYSLGKLMIFKLREDYQKQEGQNYSLKNFHDRFLEHGMPPLPLLREIMLKDKAVRKEIL